MQEKKSDFSVSGIFRFAYAWNVIAQAAFSMLCPVGLLLLGARLLTTRCGAGRWVTALAIILGVFIGFYSMIRYIIQVQNAVDPTASGGKGGSSHERASGKK